MDLLVPDFAKLGSDALRTIVENMPIAAIFIDGERVYLNRAAEELTGYERHEIGSQDEWYRRIFPDGHEAVRALYEDDRAAGFQVLRELVIRRKDGSTRTVEFAASGSGLAICIMHDITERRLSEELMNARLRLLQFAGGHTLDELLHETIAESERLSGSSVGFYHFLEEDQLTLSLQAWSTNPAMNSCRVRGVGQHYNIPSAGVWGECIRERRPTIFNDYTSVPYRRGLPEGHVAVNRELVVPVMRGDRVVAVLAVGNKQTDYDERDVAAVSLLADLAWEIVEKKRVEQQVEHHAQQCLAIVNTTMDGFWEIDRQGKIITANEESCRMYGYDHSEILGMSLRDFEASETEEEIGNHCRQIISQGFDRFETRHRCRDGRVIDVEVSVAFLPATGHFLAFTRDITERKQMERSLRVSEERYRLFSALTSDYVYSCSRRGNDPYRIAWLGGAIETITGYTPEEIAAKGCWLQIVYPDDVARISEGLMRLAPGDTHAAEFRIVRKDGTVRWVHEACRCLEGGRPDELILFGTSQDITLRRQQDRDIKILNENLEHLVTERTLELGKINEELASFSYAVSHELRAPIARLIGFSNALNDEALSAGETRFLAERISAASGQLQGVVDAILMLSRLSKVELSLQPVDLSEIVRQKIASQLAEQPERQVELAVDPGVVAVADPALMEVCIENLVGNALKYTGQTTGARIEFGVTEQHGQRVFFVRDNGAGFDMDFAEKLYAPFQRLHREDEFPGMGIGLATVERIIDRHHGRIWAEARVGGGATFYFMLGERPESKGRPG